MKSRNPICLIGHTGFVGSAISEQFAFTHCFNSSNIDSIEFTPTFELTVCAAAPGSMLEANRNPEQDLAQIRSLMHRLDSLKTRHFVLISTIAVLARLDAGFDEAAADFETTLAYGRNRRTLEQYCSDRFEECLIVRLPALFGSGLRKNFLFDLLNPIPSMLSQQRVRELELRIQPDLFRRLRPLYKEHSMLDFVKLDRASLNALPDRRVLEKAVADNGFSAVCFHNPGTTFQYYDITRLSVDITCASRAGLPAIHLATEPLLASAIHQRLLGNPMLDMGARLHREDMHTRHAVLWSRNGPYLEDAEAVLDRIHNFYVRERSRS